LFHAHIGGADTFARGLIVADKILNDSNFSSTINKRYSSFDSGDGKKFENGNLSLEDLFQIAKNSKNIEKISGKTEFLENIINNYI
jgi:xylose isomerase